MAAAGAMPATAAMAAAVAMAAAAAMAAAVVMAAAAGKRLGNWSSNPAVISTLRRRNCAGFF
jgi:hypothetical protein